MLSAHHNRETGVLPIVCSSFSMQSNNSSSKGNSKGNRSYGTSFPSLIRITLCICVVSFLVHVLFPQKIFHSSFFRTSKNKCCQSTFAPTFADDNDDYYSHANNAASAKQPPKSTVQQTKEDYDDDVDIMNGFWLNENYEDPYQD